MNYIHCAGWTRKGDRCRNNGNCPHHKAANRQRHINSINIEMDKIRHDNRPTNTRFTREQIQEFLARGYREEFTNNPCGCQG